MPKIRGWISPFEHCCNFSFPNFVSFLWIFFVLKEVFIKEKAGSFEMQAAQSLRFVLKYFKNYARVEFVQFLILLCSGGIFECLWSMNWVLKQYLFKIRWDNFVSTTNLPFALVEKQLRNLWEISKVLSDFKYSNGDTVITVFKHCIKTEDLYTQSNVDWLKVICIGYANRIYMRQ